MVHFGGALLKRLDNDRRADQSYCDVRINTDGVIFDCHRFLLGAASGYFNRIFHSNFVESKSAELTVEGPIGCKISAATMKYVIDFIYTENVVLTDETAHSILLTADYLDIEHLCPPCIQYLEGNINPNTWLDTFRTASQLDIEPLLLLCMNKFPAVSKDINFDNFEFPELKYVLDNQHERMECTKVFETIIAWLKFDESTRKCYFDDLIMYTDFESMTPTYVNEQVLTTDIINEHPKVVVYISTILVYKLLQTCKTDDPAAGPVSEPDLMIIGGEGPLAQHSVVTYCPNSKQFSHCASSPNPCSDSNVTYHGDQIIVAGGKGNFCDVQTYNMTANTWKVERNFLLLPRYGAKATVVHDRLYIVAGYDGQVLSSTEIFDISEDGLVRITDNQFPSLQQGRCNHVAIAKEEEIYIIGKVHLLFSQHSKM